jgi:hypothetical protein
MSTTQMQPRGSTGLATKSWPVLLDHDGLIDPVYEKAAKSY